MMNFYLKDDFIKLGQLLKAAGLCENGVEAKYDIAEGLVKVNGETETRRGRKITEGDIVNYKDADITVKRKQD